MTIEQRWLTTAQAATYLGLTVKAVEQKVAKRQIPFSKIGDSKRSPNRFDIRELDAWMADRRVPVGGVLHGGAA